MAEIKVEYNGEYPNLCSGELKITIDGIVWDFGVHCLSSGGSVSFDKEWNEEVTSGEWSIADWPDGFPEGLKAEVEDTVNMNVERGCCGGCV